jgi:chloramphenicol O-acetyltransferase type A
MKQKLDINTWNRKEHYLFFKQMEEPFFGINTTIDCTKAYQTSKAAGSSFFANYLHKTLVAVNTVEPFRYRIVEDEVYIYDRIDASATLMRKDSTFGFSLIEYHENSTVFAESVVKEVARVEKTSGLFTCAFDINLIHFSTIPWINITAISHARSFSFPDSCPKITFGKIMDDNGIKTMTMSIHVHHGLMDGFHVGQFVNLFQELMNS